MARFSDSSITRIVTRKREQQCVECPEEMAELDGTATPGLLSHLKGIAKEKSGFVAVRTYVAAEGKSSLRQPGVHNELMIPSLFEMAGAVHENKGRLLILLSHTGRWDINSMSSVDISRLVIQFGQAAARAKAAGCDGVRLDISTDELLGRFLSPCYNKRGDSYGGSLANRSRFLMEVMGAIRCQTGNGFSMTVEVHPEDAVLTGATAADLKEVARMAEAFGVDCVDGLAGPQELTRILSMKRVDRLPEKDIIHACAAASGADSYHFIPRVIRPVERPA